MEIWYVCRCRICICYCYGFAYILQRLWSSLDPPIWKWDKALLWWTQEMLIPAKHWFPLAHHRKLRRHSTLHWTLRWTQPLTDQICSFPINTNTWKETYDKMSASLWGLIILSYAQNCLLSVHPCNGPEQCKCGPKLSEHTSESSKVGCYAQYGPKWIGQCEKCGI